MKISPDSQETYTEMSNLRDEWKTFSTYVKLCSKGSISILFSRMIASFTTEHKRFYLIVRRGGANQIEETNVPAVKC
ncbi:hypothetical protein ACOSQ2_005016 [Xanthoceras sorbifolium]